MSKMLYRVELIITNKEGIRDPEGETIQRYVVSRFSDKITETRAGKYLVFRVNSSSQQEATELVKKLADEMRLYNPIVHKIEIRANKIEDSSN
ncbi:phosphoribosylformylglycinamidine synthase subunit PurS [Sulfurisphaera ohwakuensis]|uniref:Phosphoribosylformylglycinamidine synthase subunit PurS n=2 Tax=Sulfurisphaera ohwakuensis TaxID=69656 RepID=A0A650CH72_SULOH|nr:phosphoribosylformylglycinamidine synthase subunit PurS [Sulfurisphaera ohwakuensis]